MSHRDRAKRSFKVFALTETAAKDTKFKLQPRGNGGPAAPEEEIETDLVTYFKKAYNISLNFPMLPCVQAGKNITLPIEMCSVIEGQRYMKKLDERQTAVWRSSSFFMYRWPSMTEHISIGRVMFLPAWTQGSIGKFRLMLYAFLK